MILKELIKALPEEPQVFGSLEVDIEDIVFDSRKAVKDVLFVAQKGEKVDGHDYIGKAYEQGCRAFLCEQKPNKAILEATVIVVNDSHLALGLLASYFFGEPSKKMKLVGVTGTNGKTTTATLLYRLFSSMGHKCGLFSTVANYICNDKVDATHTTPDAVELNRQMRKMVDLGCQYCFMEVSSHSVVQHRIAGLDFDGAIFTNITHDHLDYHKTFAAYIQAKKAFFDGLKPTAFALTNMDDKNGMVMLQNTVAEKKSYSLRSLADFKTSIVEQGFEGTLLNMNGQEAFMLFVGKFNAYNLTAIYGAACLLGLDSKDVLRVLSTLTPVDGRFETIRSKDNKTAIVDYAHTPDALMNVISTINEIRKESQNLICVVGCGGDRDKTKRPVMARESVNGCQIVILTSDNPRSEEPQDILNDMLAGLDDKQKRQVITIADRREAIKTASRLAKPGDIILIAGKGHETYQDVKGVKHHFDDREEVREAFKY
ncbi:MAG: UDP-N-acetylmuramoyl-L-alanyl-D-glutamate--2,6-diaminopimelate ligase [Marinilabiliaceae bacterium]|nr:UDP-N-acetylmuramoyl-L-alanyl-D-glutamate--2,6-diaminopimelate ligase [Marinilabiliaceae bacterium]